MNTTPGERLALSVVALLLATGAAVRFSNPDPPPLVWAGEPPSAAGTLGALEGRVEREVRREVRSSTPLAPGERIDPNRAGTVELERLPEVGPELAAEIVAHRERHGRFRTLGDLDAVSGIGPATLEALAAHVTLPPGPATAEMADGPGPPTAEPLDLNAATGAELESLPEIGPVLAERILAWRREHGDFRSIDDLLRVSGVGPATLERIAPFVSVSP